ncbi:UNVERIFIED_CONTAM: zinc finger protein [Trichonephila clavipes]
MKKELPDVCEQSNLKRHLLLHTKEKPNGCDFCNAAFSARSSLKMHLRIHTKEMPYICEICEKAFSRSVYLKRHLQIHIKEICVQDFLDNSTIIIGTLENGKLNFREICKKAFSNF